MTERDAIKEPQRADRLVESRPGNPRRNQMDLEGELNRPILRSSAKKSSRFMTLYSAIRTNCSEGMLGIPRLEQSCLNSAFPLQSIVPATIRVQPSVPAKLPEYATDCEAK